MQPNMDAGHRLIACLKSDGRFDPTANDPPAPYSRSENRVSVMTGILPLVATAIPIPLSDVSGLMTGMLKPT